MPVRVSVAIPDPPSGFRFLLGGKADLVAANVCRTAALEVEDLLNHRALPRGLDRDEFSQDTVLEMEGLFEHRIEIPHARGPLPEHRLAGAPGVHDMDNGKRLVDRLDLADKGFAKLGVGPFGIVPVALDLLAGRQLVEDARETFEMGIGRHFPLQTVYQTA